MMNVLSLFLLTALVACNNAFAPSHGGFKIKSQLRMAEKDAAAPVVSGADLEMMLTEWDQPLVVDAYAT